MDDVTIEGHPTGSSTLSESQRIRRWQTRKGRMGRLSLTRPPTSFERWRISTAERIRGASAHAKGFGAFGVFETHAGRSRLTRPKIFSRAKKCDWRCAFFDSLQAKRGSRDTWRSARGSPSRCIPKNGNFDMVETTRRSSSIRGSVLKFPAFHPRQKRRADNRHARCMNCRPMPVGFSGRCPPESAHQVTLSDGRPRQPETLA